jgi:hypothetical protein
MFEAFADRRAPASLGKNPEGFVAELLRSRQIETA